jgi:hypothetical protein
MYFWQHVHRVTCSKNRLDTDRPCPQMSLPVLEHLLQCALGRSSASALQVRVRHALLPSSLQAGAKAARVPQSKTRPTTTKPEGHNSGLGRAKSPARPRLRPRALRNSKQRKIDLRSGSKIQPASAQGVYVERHAMTKCWSRQYSRHVCLALPFAPRPDNLPESSQASRRAVHRLIQKR